MPTANAGRTLIRHAREIARVVYEEIRAHPVAFGLLTGAVFVAYLGLIFALTVLSTEKLPNYFRRFAVVEGIVENLTLPMPLAARYESLAEQPLFEFAHREPAFGQFEAQYTLTLHTALNLFLISSLIAVYVLLFIRVPCARRLGRRGVASLGVGAGGSGAMVLTAGAASVACCGGTGAPFLLTLLGSGVGGGLLGTFVVEHDEAFGGLGVILMLVNLWFVSSRLSGGYRARRVAGG